MEDTTEIRGGKKTGTQTEKRFHDIAKNSAFGYKPHLQDQRVSYRWSHIRLRRFYEACSFRICDLFACCCSDGCLRCRTCWRTPCKQPGGGSGWPRRPG